MTQNSKRKILTVLVFLLIPVIIAILLLVGLPRLSELNPVRLVQRIKKAIAERKIREPIQISQIVVNPRNPQILYASSHFYGMLKSTDQGKTWKFTVKGLGTSDVYSMAMHPLKPDTLYAATTGGGVYRSNDGAATWIEVNTGLTDTHVEDLAFDPANPDTLYAATLRQVFKSTDGGLTWQPVFNENPYVAPAIYVHTLLVARPPGFSKPVIFIGTPAGGFRRVEGDKQWESLLEKVGGDKLTSFAYDSRIQTLYAGSMMGKFYVSQDGGKTWSVRGSVPAGAMWIHRIALHPQDPSVIFAGSRGHGIFKSVDGGRSWTEIDNGITHKMIKALVIDPTNPQLVYAGAPGMLATSSDGGGTWTPVKLELPRYAVVVSWLSYTKKSNDSTPPPPPEMREKCNECHGWTDPLLNYKPAAYWRVSPSRRDWKETMSRMGVLAKLTPQEKVIIYGYLNNHFGPQ